MAYPDLPTPETSNPRSSNEYGLVILPKEVIGAFNWNPENQPLDASLPHIQNNPEDWVDIVPIVNLNSKLGTPGKGAKLGTKTSLEREQWAQVLVDFNEYLGTDEDFREVKNAAVFLPGLPEAAFGQTLKGRTEQILAAYRRKWRDAGANNSDEWRTYLPRFLGRTGLGPFDNSDPIYSFKNLKEGTLSYRNFSFTDYGPPSDQWSPLHVYVRLVALHSALFGVRIGPNFNNMPITMVGSSLRPRAGFNGTGGAIQASAMFSNIKVGVSELRVLLDDAVPAVGTSLGNFTVSSLTEEEKDDMLGNPSYNQLFTTTFDSNIITLIPIIYNFYLTTEYFQGINQAFENPKDRVLDIILSTIANDNNFNSTPDLTRPAAAATIADSTGQDKDSAFNSASRDFILKMLIKTPIDILKGVVELVDPHVAISKVIKTGTGFAFNEAASAIDVGAKQVNEAIREATADLPEPLEPSLTGEDLLSLIFCLLDNLMNDGLQEASGLDVPENFFPRISIDGVDFTGTVSGMLMMPPSPLGLIYLLLELLMNGTQNVAEANTENANANECSDPVDPIIDESPCGDSEEQS
tara:strand:+ start:600 stop:2336 length:1737 start_codon:yes stop_codon:yes gene_type:complete